MTATSQRRVRLLRLRGIEHRVAKARLARAEGHLANLNRINERIALLKAGLGVEAGPTDGISLHARVEMEQRLDNARTGMAGSISEAESNRAQYAALRIRAQQREDSAAKLHDKARRDEDAIGILRADANRPHLKRKRFSEPAS